MKKIIDDNKNTLRTHYFIGKQKLIECLCGLSYMVINEEDIIKRTNKFINYIRNFNNEHIICQRDQQSSWAFTHSIKAALLGDRCRRAEKSCSAVEYLLASNTPLIRKVWIRTQGWYKDTVDRPPLPSRVALTTMTA